MNDFVILRPVCSNKKWKDSFNEKLDESFNQMSRKELIDHNIAAWQQLWREWNCRQQEAPIDSLSIDDNKIDCTENDNKEINENKCMFLCGCS